MAFLFPRAATAVLAVAALSSPFASPAAAQGRGNGVGPDLTTQSPAQVTGLGDWSVAPIFTVGESVTGYRPPGILDGLGATALDHRTVRVYANHEVRGTASYPYTLANGTTLLGSRISRFDLNRSNRKLVGAGLAYTRIVDRYGVEVTSARQINEGTSTTTGLDRLCSAALFEAGTFGLVDTIYFTGEETSDGQMTALDTATGVLYVVPMAGRAQFESITMLDSAPGTVAFLIGDDTAGAPFYLYVGTKNARGDGSFLDRNGLASGSLYAWVANSGETTPAQFFGTGASRTGRFVAVPHFDPARAGTAGYDAAGYASQATQTALALAAGAFRFSRPEDLATDPANGTRAIFASTGRADFSDTWGTTYVIDVALGAAPTGTIRIAYDGDDAGAGQFANPDLGLRSPDNLDWADDGFAYLQEDRSTPPGLFGAVSRVEASIWQMAPATGALTRVAVVDRSAVPAGQTDTAPADFGNWETSGIIDVTGLFRTIPGERLFLLDVQAHSLRGGPIATYDLVEGGQLLFLATRTAPGQQPRGTSGASLSAPTGATLLAPSPNPTSGTTAVDFELAEAAEVSVEVVDALGRRVALLQDGFAEAGTHRATLDTSSLPAGVYVVRLQAGAQQATHRLTVVR